MVTGICTEWITPEHAENLLGCPARATAGSAGSVLGKALLSWSVLWGGQQGRLSCWWDGDMLMATGTRGEGKWMSGRHVSSEVSIWQRQTGSRALAVTRGRSVGGLWNTSLRLPSRYGRALLCALRVLEVPEGRRPRCVLSICRNCTACACYIWEALFYSHGWERKLSSQGAQKLDAGHWVCPPIQYTSTNQICKSQHTKTFKGRFGLFLNVVPLLSETSAF